MDERLAHRPKCSHALHQMADTLDQSAGDDCSADQAKARVSAEMLAQWVHEANTPTQAPVRAQHPSAIGHGKQKTLKWQTMFGWVTVEEAQWRLGWRDPVLRPFCERTGVRPQGRSRRLQRVLVDFGPEESFARAGARVQDHYGLDVVAEQVRQETLQHGAQISALIVSPPKQAAPTLVTQLDGRLIPVVVAPTAGLDRRRGKQLIWREGRLCLARLQASATPCYGAALGSVAVSWALWRATAQAAGLGERTQLHGVCDGAEWILTQFQEQGRAPSQMAH